MASTRGGLRGPGKGAAPDGDVEDALEEVGLEREAEVEVQQVEDVPEEHLQCKGGHEHGQIFVAIIRTESRQQRQRPNQHQTCREAIDLEGGQGGM